MNPTMKDLGIDRLSPEQRTNLALEIWESLNPPSLGTQLSKTQREELSRRDAELDANPELALSWRQLREGLKTRQS